MRTLAQLPGPRGLPLVGNLPSVELSRLHRVLEDWATRYGELFCFRLGPQRFLAVGNGELSRKVFMDRPEGFRRLHTMEAVARELGMHGVFSAEGADWKRQRALITPAFKDDNLATSYPVLQAITRRLLVQLGQAANTGAPIDILDYLMRYTVDGMAVVAFGRDMNTLERGKDELQAHLETIFPMLLRRMNAPIPYWRWFRLPADRALDRSIRAVRATLLPMIEAARASIAHDASETHKPANLLEALICAADTQGAGSAARFDDEEVLANVLTLLLAGEDTTANTLAWMFYFVAKYPQVQERLRAELEQLSLRDNVLPDYSFVARLPYLTAVTHETLRLKSPAPIIFLEAVADTELNDVRVPAGTPVILLTRHSAMQEHNFPAPTRFDPDRWLGLPGGPTRAHLARASLPFGAGPRTCPGRQLSLLECALCVSSVVSAFQLSLATNTNVEEYFDFAMEPEGLRLQLSPV